MTFLTHLINKTLKLKTRNILYFRNSDKFDSEIFNYCRNFNFWVLNIEENKPWDYSKFILKDNVSFIFNIKQISEIDIKFIIAPNLIDIKYFSGIRFIPLLSLFHREPKNDEFRSAYYGNKCFCASKEIEKAWKIPEKRKIIINNLNTNLLADHIKEFYRESFE